MRIMKRAVRYIESRKKHPSQERLTIGNIYIVEEEKKIAYGTYVYRLKGVEGWFASDSFSKMESYVAISDKHPKKGDACECMRIFLEGGTLKLEKCEPERILEVEEMGNNIYRVNTWKKIYYVSVGYGGEY